jgi:hypothetical protein
LLNSLGKEKHYLGLFENVVLRRIYGNVRKEREREGSRKVAKVGR